MTDKPFALIREFRSLASGIQLVFQQEFQSANANLTKLQADVLLHIHEQKDNVYQRDIENIFNIRRSTATQLLSTMEQNGWITRQNTSTDNRLKNIALTPLTIHHLQKVKSTINKVETLLLQNLDSQDLDTLKRIISKMKENVNLYQTSMFK